MELLDNRILWLYENRIVRDFPVSPFSVLRVLPNCRYQSYRTLARLGGVRTSDIARMFGSADGCTHYDPKADRYLIAVNDEGRSRARVRWTFSHELGHILAGHFTEIANGDLREVSPSELPCMEEEADYFAASFLAPLAAIRKIRAKSAADIRDWFDISQTAAEYRWSEYIHNTGPTCLDGYYSWASARSAIKTGRIMNRKPNVYY